MFTFRKFRWFLVSLSMIYASVSMGQANPNREPDPWGGSFRAKEISSDSNFASPIQKLVLSGESDNHYKVTAEVGSLNSQGRTKSILHGIATLYLPHNDKAGTDRLLVSFLGLKNAVLIEVYPGAKSSSVRNSGYTSLRYTYFENGRWPEYASGELSRESTRKR